MWQHDESNEMNSGKSGDRTVMHAPVTVEAVHSGREFSFVALPPRATVAWLLSEVIRRDADVENAQQCALPHAESNSERTGCNNICTFGITTVDGTALDMEADVAVAIVPGVRLRAVWPPCGSAHATISAVAGAAAATTEYDGALQCH